jgi:hypothetical protein
MAGPSKEILEALVRIKGSEPKLVEWLQERLEAHKHALVSIDDQAFRVAQGRAKEVASIIETIQQASTQLQTNRTAK